MIDAPLSWLGVQIIHHQPCHLQHRQDGPRYVYLATLPHQEARESAMRRVLRTFFGGSASSAVAALLDMEADNLSDEELNQLASLVDEARKKGR